MEGRDHASIDEHDGDARPAGWVGVPDAVVMVDRFPLVALANRAVDVSHWSSRAPSASGRARVEAADGRRSGLHDGRAEQLRQARA